MFRRRKTEGSNAPADVYNGLRKLALEVTEATVGSGAPAHPDVLGALIDIPHHGGMVSVVALADGTTSMYTSVGGGTIGAGSHDTVAQAAHALLAALQERIEMFPADERVDLPPGHLVQITVITRTGRRRASVPEAAFWGREPSTVVELIGAIQDLISTIREAEPS